MAKRSKLESYFESSSWENVKGCKEYNAPYEIFQDSQDLNEIDPVEIVGIR